MEEQDKMWPSWLSPLLRTAFFVSCKFHGGSSRHECNMYCLDCSGSALCSSCLIDHRHHRVIQIRRSSYHDVIRVNEIQKHLDISGVQTYIINGARIVFLNERPQHRSGKIATNACCNCRKSLLDAFDYCSLGCKLAKSTIAKEEGKPVSPHSELRKDASKMMSHWQRLDHISPPNSTPAIIGNRAAKRRKGIPQRAPMGVC